MASRMWRRYTRSFCIEDHHCVAVYCIGKVGAHSVLSDEIHAHVEVFSEFIPRKFEKLAAKRTYWEKWVKEFLSPEYASKLLSQ